MPKLGPDGLRSDTHSPASSKRKSPIADDDMAEEDEEPVRKRSRREHPASSRTSKSNKVSDKTRTHTTDHQKGAKYPNVSTASPGKAEKPTPLTSAESVDTAESEPVDDEDEGASEADEGEENENEIRPKVTAKACEKVQSVISGSGKDPYPDWKAGDPVPYAAMCTTFSLIEMTTKRLIISSHCSLFLRQVLRLTPNDLLPTVQLMINKLAADYAGIELGIGESLIMKAIGEATGRSLAIIKADQNEIGDLGLVAAKSRSNQPTMFKPKPLTVRGVLDSLMSIATVQGGGSQQRKIDGIKKLLSAADVAHAGKGSKGIDITKDKGGRSEAKFIIRFLEGKLRLGLAEKTVLVALAHAMVIHENEKNGKEMPSTDKLAQGEAILKTVYR